MMKGKSINNELCVLRSKSAYIRRTDDESESTAFRNPSKRLREKARVLKKGRIGLQDMLQNVDERNKKFGFLASSLSSPVKNTFSKCVLNQVRKKSPRKSMSPRKVSQSSDPTGRMKKSSLSAETSASNQAESEILKKSMDFDVVIQSEESSKKKENSSLPAPNHGKNELNKKSTSQDLKSHTQDASKETDKSTVDIKTHSLRQSTSKLVNLHYTSHPGDMLQLTHETRSSGLTLRTHAPIHHKKALSMKFVGPDKVDHSGETSDSMNKMENSNLCTEKSASNQAVSETPQKSMNCDILSQSEELLLSSDRENSSLPAETSASIQAESEISKKSMDFDVVIKSEESSKEKENFILFAETSASIQAESEISKKSMDFDVVIKSEESSKEKENFSLLAETSASIQAENEILKKSIDFNVVIQSEESSKKKENSSLLAETSASIQAENEILKKSIDFNVVIQSEESSKEKENSSLPVPNHGKNELNKKSTSQDVKSHTQDASKETDKSTVDMKTHSLRQSTSKLVNFHYTSHPGDMMQLTHKTRSSGLSLQTYAPIHHKKTSMKSVGPDKVDHSGETSESTNKMENFNLHTEKSASNGAKCKSPRKSIDPDIMSHSGETDTTNRTENFNMSIIKGAPNSPPNIMDCGVENCSVGKSDSDGKSENFSFLVGLDVVSHSDEMPDNIVQTENSSMPVQMYDPKQTKIKLPGKSIDLDIVSPLCSTTDSADKTKNSTSPTQKSDKNQTKMKSPRKSMDCDALHCLSNTSDTTDMTENFDLPAQKSSPNQGNNNSPKKPRIQDAISCTYDALDTPEKTENSTVFTLKSFPWKAKNKSPIKSTYLHLASHPGNALKLSEKSENSCLSTQESSICPEVEMDKPNASASVLECGISDLDAENTSKRKTYNCQMKSFVVLEKLPSWINEYRRAKVIDKNILQPLVFQEKSVRLNEIESTSVSNISHSTEKESYWKDTSSYGKQQGHKLLNKLSKRNRQILFKRKREIALPNRRLTRSLGEKVQVDFNAKLPDSRHVKTKRMDLNENSPFHGFNVPFGILGLPDHYLVYKNIFDSGRQDGYYIDEVLGAGSLDVKSKVVYFTDENNPFKSGPVTSNEPGEKISSTKIFDKASSTTLNQIDKQFDPEKLSSEDDSIFSLVKPSKSVKEMNDLYESQGIFESSFFKSQNDPTKSNSAFLCQNDSSSSTLNPASSSSKPPCDIVTLESGLENELVTEIDEDAGTPHSSDISESSCNKDFCRLGCICESLEVRDRKEKHCDHEECMFSSTCCQGSNVFHDHSKPSLLGKSYQSSPDEDLVRSKRKRRAPVRLLEDEMIYDKEFSPKKQSLPDYNLPSMKNPIILNDCRILLSKFHLSGANVRCLIHLRLDCPCVTKRPGLENPTRNVALKSTSRRLVLNPCSSVKQPPLKLNSLSVNKLHLGKSPWNVAVKSTSQRLGLNQHCVLNRSGSQNHSYPKSLAFSVGNDFDAKNVSVLKRDLPKKVPTKKWFRDFREFQEILTRKKLKCRDLDLMCSNSLAALPKNVVKIMKVSVLKHLMSMELAFVWLMRLPNNRAHVFLTQKSKSPGVACIPLKNLDELSKLPPNIASIFNSAESSDIQITCCILISHVYFWEINGSINSVSKFNRSTFEDSESSETLADVSVIANFSNNNPSWSAKSLKSPSTQRSLDSGTVDILEIPKAKSHSSPNILELSKKQNSSSSHTQSCSRSSALSLESHSSTAPVLLNHPYPKSNDKSLVWYHLNLNGEFDELRVEGTAFGATHAQLVSIVNMAREKKCIIRLSFNFKYPKGRWQQGIYADPVGRGLSVRIGPYHLNENPSLKTFTCANGISKETIPLLVMDKVLSQSSNFLNIHAAEKVSNVESIDLESENTPSEHVNAKEGMEVSYPDPNIEENISSEDADPGFTIRIENVQGNWAGFDDISDASSPKDKIVSSQMDEDLIDVVSDTEINSVNLGASCQGEVAAGQKSGFELQDTCIPDANSKIVKRTISPAKSQDSQTKAKTVLTKESSKCLTNATPKGHKKVVKITLGYLVPDVPGIHPIPVARGGMTENESKAITMRNPMTKGGNPIHFLDLEKANTYLNQSILKVVNFFPNNMSISWSFVKVDGMGCKGDFEGLIHVADLTRDVFITPRGVFSYDELPKTSLQRYGINKVTSHRFLEAKRRRHIYLAKKEILDLLSVGKPQSLIGTIDLARKEINNLETCGKILRDHKSDETLKKNRLLTTLRLLSTDAEMLEIMRKVEAIKRVAPKSHVNNLHSSSDAQQGSSTQQEAGTVTIDNDSQKANHIRKLSTSVDKPSVQSNSKDLPKGNTRRTLSIKDQFRMLKNAVLSKNHIQTMVEPDYSASTFGYSILKSNSNTSAVTGAPPVTTSSVIVEVDFSQERELDIDDQVLPEKKSESDEEMDVKSPVECISVPVLDEKDGLPCFSKAKLMVPQKKLEKPNMTITLKGTEDADSYQAMMKLKGTPPYVLVYQNNTSPSMDKEGKLIKAQVAQSKAAAQPHP